MSRPLATESVFRAIADPTRRAILDMLRRGDRTAGEIAHPFPHKFSTISAHLRVLRGAGLISQRRAGRQRVYGLAARPLRPVAEWLVEYEPHVRGLVRPATAKGVARRG